MLRKIFSLPGSVRISYTRSGVAVTLVCTAMLYAGPPTAGASDTYSCSGSGAALTAPVCNRGSSPIGAGLSVGFYVAGAKVCGTTTTQALLPGACATVGCTWTAPPTTQGKAIDVDVIADDNSAYKECKTGNDHGAVLAVFCVPQN